jgi:3-methyladenine DNA glycosylase AlkD
MDAETAADALEAQIRAAGTPERAEGEKRYLKSDLEFLGAPLGEIRRSVAAFARSTSLDHDAVVRMLDALWSRPVFERRMAAVLLLGHHQRLLSVADLGLVERMIRESRTWALVDALAGDVVGRLLLAEPEAATTLDRWATDDDFWVRRSALLAHLRRLRAGDGLGDFGRYADAMLDEREFFIRKAIGWVLREAGKRRPDAVVAWLEPRVPRASGVTMREAVKYLPRADADRLMGTYRSRRAASRG